MLLLVAVDTADGQRRERATEARNRRKSKQYSLLILVISILILILILLRLLYRVQRGHSTLSTRQSSTTPFSIL